jgi:hypothetical protein
LVATALTGFTLVAAIFLTADFAHAGEDAPARVPSGDSACSCPDYKEQFYRPKFADLRPELDESDEIAALESVQYALSTVGDGASYVWRRGRLSGLVQPTSSFRNPAGAICRHLIVLLTTGQQTQKAEGVACRLPNGLWQLEG